MSLWQSILLILLVVGEHLVKLRKRQKIVP